jgi:hypothetical protein
MADGAGRHRLEGVVIAVAVAQGSSQPAVELLDVGLAQAAGVVDVVAALEGGLGHEADHAATGGRRYLERVGVEAAQRVERQALLLKRQSDLPDHEKAEAAEVRGTDVGDEDRNSAPMILR